MVAAGAARPSKAASTRLLQAVFATRKEAEAANIPSALRPVEILLLGYHAAGDGGGARYVYRPTRPRHPGSFASSDGAFWEIEGDELSFRQFGARGNGKSDDTFAMRSAILAAATLGARVRAGSGDFVATGDIVLPLGSAGVDIVGNGWNVSRIHFVGTGVTHGLWHQGTPGKYAYAGKIADLRIACRNGAPRGYTASWVNHPRLERVILADAKGCAARFENSLMASFEECLVVGSGFAEQAPVEIDRCTTFSWRHSRISGSRRGTLGGLKIDRSSDVSITEGNVESAGIPIRIGSEAEVIAPCEGVTIERVDLEDPAGCYIEVGYGWRGPPARGVVRLSVRDVHGTPSGATSIPFGVKLRNTSGAEFDRAWFGLTGGPRAAFLFEGPNRGAVVRAQPERNGQAWPWIMQDTRVVQGSSPDRDWFMPPRPRRPLP